MTGAGRKGVSIVEVLVALVVLSGGLLLLAGGSITVTRDLVQARLASQAATMAETRLDLLRARAASTVPRCAAPLFASSRTPVTYEGVTLSWIVPPSGAARVVRAVASYPVGRGRVRTDTLTTVIEC